VFEAPVQQQPLLQTPASVDYYSGDTLPLEFSLADLLGGSADEIGGTQLSGAPPVTQPMQEKPRAMMEDFHDSARRVGEALDAEASVEPEARATGRGRPHRARRPTRTDRSRGRHVGLSKFTGSHQRGAGTSGSVTPQAATGRGAVPSGSGAPLATPPPPRAGGRRTRSPSTRPPHVPDPPHEGCIEGGGSAEEEGASGHPTTDETWSYLDLYFDTCRVQYFICSNYFMYFRIQLPAILHL
jgi:hypothetical protein